MRPEPRDGSPPFPPRPEVDGAELDLILACIRARFGADGSDRVRAAAQAGVHGGRLATIARRHRVGALVARSLRDAGVNEPAVVADVNQAARVVGLRGLRMVNGLARTLDLLADAGIRPLALKGPVMAVELYGDVGLRPSGDLDLLIATDQLTLARHTLEAAGFRPDPALSEKEAAAYLDAGFAYSFRDDKRDVVVEIHPSLAHRAFRFAPDLAELWRRAATRSVAGRDVLTLSPEDRLLFLCVHGAKHEWDQLVWVCDVAEALRAAGTLDWVGVTRRAAETGSLRMLQLGVHLAHAFTGVSLPVEAAVLAAKPGMRRLALQVWDRMLDPVERSPGLWRQLRFHVAVRERPAERWGQTHEKVMDRVRATAQVVRLLVAPSQADRAFVRLPPRLSVLYYVVRPVRVLLRARAGARAEALPRGAADG